MKDSAEDLRRYMQALDDESSGTLEDHPGLAELIAYTQGSLEETATAEVRDHLRQCDACVATAEDARDFFEPGRQGEVAASDIETAREWKALWQRVDADRRATAPRPGLLQGFSARALFALAASVVVAFGFTAFWAISLREEMAALRGSQETREAELKARLGQLEGDNQKLRELGQRFETQMAALANPQVNVPIYDVLPVDAGLRSGGASEAARVSVPQTAKHFILILNGAGQPDYQDYALEIVDRDNRAIWKGERLKRDAQGSFVITMERSFLRPGRYRLLLYGAKAGALTKIAEYTILFD